MSDKVIFVGIFSIIMIISLFAMIPSAIGYDIIGDNNMRAYVWDSDVEPGWHALATGVANELANDGFNVTQEIYPTASHIYSMIRENPDITIYWALSHGSDTTASTSGGAYYASDFYAEGTGARGIPLTIGITQHCGGYACYNLGTWLGACTLNNDNVTAQRFWGEGWCGEPDNFSSDISCEEALTLLGQVPEGYGCSEMFSYLNQGETYVDAVNHTTWSYAEGRKQGNRWLRYPQYCGDVNYDMVVNQTDVTILYNNVTYGNEPLHSIWDGDLNGDGNIDITDVIILNWLVNDYVDLRSPRGWYIWEKQVDTSLGGNSANVLDPEHLFDYNMDTSTGFFPDSNHPSVYVLGGNSTSEFNGVILKVEAINHASGNDKLRVYYWNETVNDWTLSYEELLTEVTPFDQINIRFGANTNYVVVLIEWDQVDRPPVVGMSECFATVFYKSDTVTEQPSIIDLSCDDTDKSIPSGGTAEYTITVKNTGNSSDTINLTVPWPIPPCGWSYKLNKHNVTLLPGESTEVILYVSDVLPHSSGDSWVVTVTGTSKGDPTKFDTVTTTTTIEQPSIFDTGPSANPYPSIM